MAPANFHHILFATAPNLIFPYGIPIKRVSKIRPVHSREAAGSLSRTGGRTNAHTSPSAIFTSCCRTTEIIRRPGKSKAGTPAGQTLSFSGSSMLHAHTPELGKIDKIPPIPFEFPGN